MFLSKESIYKQLFYEFLEHDTLALSPGKPAELQPGTLLSSSSKEDVSLGLEWAERQLKEHLSKVGNSDENSRFQNLLTDLINYKKASAKKNNLFMSQATKTNISPPNPCAWMVFGPLLINGQVKEASYETKESFINYLNNPQVAFQFKTTDYSLEKTGLYIAVKLANYEMVRAFLCSEFYQYELTKKDLKTLLSVTSDPKTRLALLKHSSHLLDWLSGDQKLKDNIILSIEELKELWLHWSKKERTLFIQHTTSKLWLNLLNNQLSKKKIENLLGKHYLTLKQKLTHDKSIRTQESIPLLMQYLSHDDQFKCVLEREKIQESIPLLMRYLTNNDQFKCVLKIQNINAVYPLPHDNHFTELLSSLGYKTQKNGTISTTRYLLPKHFARIHDNLVNFLIALPIDTSIILDALKKIEDFVHIESFVHKELVEKEYKQTLDLITQKAITIEHETSSFIKRWFYKLLRFLNIAKKSPLDAYINQLKQVIDAKPPAPLTGELIQTILPETIKLENYEKAIANFLDNTIDNFWDNIPEKAHQQIIEDPVRLDGLFRLLSTPHNHHATFIKSLDITSLNYFNTTQGIRQLTLETPSFNNQQNWLTLINTMSENNILFLGEVQSNVELLLEKNDNVFNQIKSFLPYKEDAIVQAQIIEALPKPLVQNQFLRFIDGAEIDASKFSKLLLEINKTNPILVVQCWDIIPDEQWKKWYGTLDFATEWSKSLTLLEMEDRIEFFDKLSSDGELTAEEFCDLLIGKEGKISFLWDKIPDEQWAKWMKSNNLPGGTKALLDITPPLFRLPFFKSILEMKPEEREYLYVAPDITIDNFYKEDVANILKTASDTKNIQTKFITLKANKCEQFRAQLITILENIDKLKIDLEDTLKIDLKSKATFQSILLSLFKTNDYQMKLTSISNSILKIEAAQKIILSHPLLTDEKTLKDTKEIITTLNSSLLNLNGQLEKFNVIAQADIPKDLEEQLTKLAGAIKNVEDICSVTSTIENLSPTEEILMQPEERIVLLLTQAKNIMDEVAQQMDTFRSAHSARFFKTNTMGPYKQQSLKQKLEKLKNSTQTLNTLFDEPPTNDEMNAALTEYQASFNAFKEKYESYKQMPISSPAQHTENTTLKNISTYVDEAEEQIRKLLQKTSPGYIPCANEFSVF